MRYLSDLVEVVSGGVLVQVLPYLCGHIEPLTRVLRHPVDQRKRLVSLTDDVIYVRVVRGIQHLGRAVKVTVSVKTPQN